MKIHKKRSQSRRPRGGCWQVKNNSIIELLRKSDRFIYYFELRQHSEVNFVKLKVAVAVMIN